MASGRDNGLSKSQASLLHAVCACNYLHPPQKRRHKRSVFVSRFTPSRHFLSTCFFFAILAKTAKGEFCNNREKSKQALGQNTASNIAVSIAQASLCRNLPSACFCLYLTTLKTRHLLYLNCSANHAKLESCCSGRYACSPPSISSVLSLSSALFAFQILWTIS